jgi:hypothetical protein
LDKAANSREGGFAGDMDLAANCGDASWQYGWTHYGTTGQTPARLHSLTHDVEIKDGTEWIRCASGADTFFTPNFLPS